MLQKPTREERRLAKEFITRVVKGEDTSLHWVPLSTDNTIVMNLMGSSPDDDPAMRDATAPANRLVVASVRNVSAGFVAAYDKIIRDYKCFYRNGLEAPRSTVSTTDGFIAI